MRQHPKKKVHNIWIVKPGEFTNRGNGIQICNSLKDIQRILAAQETRQNGKQRTYILQEYIEKPFLYKKRKFDIRCFMLMTTINGRMKGY